MKMTMLLLQPLPNTSYSIGSNELPTTDFWKANWIGGTILAGHKDAWSIWSKTYYSTIDLMLQNGLFVGKDQSVMNVAMAKSPNQFNLVLPQPYFDGKGDQWFYLQYYFSWLSGFMEISGRIVVLVIEGLSVEQIQRMSSSKTKITPKKSTVPLSRFVLFICLFVCLVFNGTKPWQVQPAQTYRTGCLFISGRCSLRRL